MNNERADLRLADFFFMVSCSTMNDPCQFLRGITRKLRDEISAGLPASDSPLPFGGQANPRNICARGPQPDLQEPVRLRARKPQLRLAL